MMMDECRLVQCTQILIKNCFMVLTEKVAVLYCISYMFSLTKIMYVSMFV